MIDLITTHDIANMLGLRPNYVRDKIVKHPTFPRPTLMVSQKTRRWTRHDVEQWLRKNAEEMTR